MTDSKASSRIEAMHASNSGSHASGRTSFGVRGNAVWEWKTETGNFSCDISTQRLRALQASELSLAVTARVQKLGGISLLDDISQSGIVKLYDRDKSHRESQKSTTNTKLETARKPIKDLRRLQEWIEMKKRLANEKDED